MTPESSERASYPTILSWAATVQLIMTPRADWYTCRQRDHPASILQHLDKWDFDLAPVVQARSVVGFVLTKDLPKVSSISQTRRDLLAEDIIGHDTPIRELITLLHAQARRPPFFVLRGKQLMHEVIM